MRGMNEKRLDHGPAIGSEEKMLDGGDLKCSDDCTLLLGHQKQLVDVRINPVECLEIEFRERIGNQLPVPRQRIHAIDMDYSRNITAGCTTDYHRCEPRT